MSKITPAAMQVIEKMLLDGSIIMYAEYRLSNARTVEWMDKTTGKASSFDGVWHTVETGKKSFYIADRGLERSAEIDPDTYVTPYKKGEMVVIEILQAGYVKGKGDVFGGKIHPLTEVVKAGNLKTA